MLWLQFSHFQENGGHIFEVLVNALSREPLVRINRDSMTAFPRNWSRFRNFHMKMLTIFIFSRSCKHVSPKNSDFYAGTLNFLV